MAKDLSPPEVVKELIALDQRIYELNLKIKELDKLNESRKKLYDEFFGKLESRGARLESATKMIILDLLKETVTGMEEDEKSKQSINASAVVPSYNQGISV